MRRSLAVGGASLAVLAAPLLAAAPAVAAPGDPVAVTIVHAIPGAVVDVYVDDDLLADDFAFDGADNPLEGELPAGAEVRVRIVPGTNPEGDFTGVLIDETLEVPDTEAVSLVAALNPDERPVLVSFEDILLPTCEGDGEVVLRHTAPLGPVDIFIDGELALEALPFGEEDGGPVPADTDFDVDVAATGSAVEDAVISETIAVPEGTVLTVYAVGVDTVFAVATEVGTESCEEPVEEPVEELPVADDAPATPESVPAGAAPAGATTGTATAAAALLAALTLIVATALRRRA